MGSKKRKKEARTKESPAPRKVAKTRENPDSSNDQTPVWLFGSLDLGCPWCGDITAELAAHVLSKIKSYESMTWGQILADQKRNHSVALADCSKDARDRAIELDLDIDELFRLRFNGTQRLWGIRDRQHFKLVWWDPEHQVCPSTLKHT
jgi:hypothetical protein